MEQTYVALEKIKESQHSEEVADIVEKMPVAFGLIIGTIVLVIFSLIILFGFLVKYPDKVTGMIVINAEKSPVKLVAGTSGKLVYLGQTRNARRVNEGDYIAVIQNAADIATVKKIANILEKHDSSSLYYDELLTVLPKNVTLGELNEKYYILIKALTDIHNYYEDNLLGKQQQQLSDLIAYDTKLLGSQNDELGVKQQNLAISYNTYLRDSSLFREKVMSPADYERSYLQHYSAVAGSYELKKEMINNRERINDNNNRIRQLRVQISEKESELKLNLIAAHDGYINAFHQWEEHYVFKSPIKGTVEQFDFFKNNDFVRASQTVFSVIPEDNTARGEMYLPIGGAGKVKAGQKVIVMLANYPYIEYGSIKGVVGSVSQVPQPKVQSESGNNGVVNEYRVIIDLPQQMKTNYGSSLKFQFELSGTADIITADRRLIYRLFDNLKYILKE